MTVIPALHLLSVTEMIAESNQKIYEKAMYDIMHERCGLGNILPDPSTKMSISQPKDTFQIIEDEPVYNQRDNIVVDQRYLGGSPERIVSKRARSVYK